CESAIEGSPSQHQRLALAEDDCSVNPVLRKQPIGKLLCRGTDRQAEERA
ncbi:Hypothetical predicted protein, partial [Pelobates cultripes]